MHAGCKSRLNKYVDEQEECVLELELAIHAARTRMIDFTTFTMPHYEVNWHHELICDTIDRLVARDITRLIVAAPPRHGKLCADETPVLTPTGWTTHGKLMPGDYVYHPTGRAIKVLARGRQGKASLDMIFNNGEVISCHENHEWKVFDRSLKAHSVREAGCLATNKRNGQPTKLMTCTTSKKRCRYMMPLTSGVEMTEKSLPCHPYVLGAWLGDGSVKKPHISMQRSDDPVISKIEKCGYKSIGEWIHADTGVVTTSFSSGIKGLRRPIPGTMRSDLILAGVYEKKHIPHVYLFASKLQRMELLAGLVDTDGHTEIKTGRIRIVNTNKDIIKGIMHLATSLGWRPYVSKQNPAMTTSGIRGKKVVYTVGFQPTESLPTMLKRKKLIRFAPQRRVGLTEIRKRKNPLAGRCIQVDAKDGMYLVGKTLLPTHNSEIVSRRLPAYFLGRFPDAPMIACSYSAMLAQRMNRDTQRIIMSPEYGLVFPETTLNNSNVRSTSKGAWIRNSDEFEVVGRRGIYRSAGVGGSVTGFGAELAVVDDAVRNRADADSHAMQQRVWDWYTSTLYTRLEKNAIVLVTMTRWSELDLVGRLLDLQKKDPNADQWHVLSLPAMAEKNGHPGDTRPLDEVLWKNKVNRKRMMNIKANNMRDWTSMYQQRPSPEDGDVFNRKWWRYFDLEPTDLIGHLISVDGTFKDKEQSDFCVLQVWARRKSAPADLYLIDQVRARMGYIALKAAFVALCAKHPAARLKLVEDTANGTPMIEELKSTIGGIVAVQPRGSKLARAQAVSPNIQSGNVYLPQAAPWVSEYVEEFSSFPNGKNDDQVDCTTQALSRLAETRAQGQRARVISLEKPSMWLGRGAG